MDDGQPRHRLAIAAQSRIVALTASQAEVAMSAPTQPGIAPTI